MNVEERLWVLAGSFALLFGFLGYVVATFKLSFIDVRAANFRGDLTRVAILFTASGRALPLGVMALVSVIVFAAMGRPPWVPLAVITSQVLSQGSVEVIKRIFARTRPVDWVHREELGLSYPSGHATTAIVFFGTWFLIAFHSPLAHPLKLMLCTGLLFWMAGIDWSRMALRAHYFSDILGGTLFGCAWTSATFALLLHMHVPLSGA